MMFNKSQVKSYFNAAFSAQETLIQSPKLIKNSVVSLALNTVLRKQTVLLKEIVASMNKKAPQPVEETDAQNKIRKLIELSFGMMQLIEKSQLSDESKGIAKKLLLIFDERLDGSSCTENEKQKAYESVWKSTWKAMLEELKKIFLRQYKAGCRFEIMDKEATQADKDAVVMGTKILIIKRLDELRIGFYHIEEDGYQERIIDVQTYPTISQMLSKLNHGKVEIEQEEFKQKVFDSVCLFGGGIPKSVFICYAIEQDEDKKNWQRHQLTHMANDLKAAGVKVSYDLNEPLNTDLHAFSRRAGQVDCAIVIATPWLKEKWDEGKPGMVRVELEAICTKPLLNHAVVLQRGTFETSVPMGFTRKVVLKKYFHSDSQSVYYYPGILCLLEYLHSDQKDLLRQWKCDLEKALGLQKSSSPQSIHFLQDSPITSQNRKVKREQTTETELVTSNKQTSCNIPANLIINKLQVRGKAKFLQVGNSADSPQVKIGNIATNGDSAISTLSKLSKAAQLELARNFF